VLSIMLRSPTIEELQAHRVSPKRCKRSRKCGSPRRSFQAGSPFKPNCDLRSSDCEDIEVINTLDGFNLQPRLSIPCDGSVDASTVTSETVFLISLGDALNGEDHGGHRIGINQVVWDELTNTLHVQSDEQLDQHTRYALVVTNRVLDTRGFPVAASESFLRFRSELNFGQTHDANLKRYRKALLDALDLLRGAGVQESDIVSASVFSTQSTTAILEKMRDQIKASTAPPADFNLRPDKHAR
jgi:hypothetical protein